MLFARWSSPDRNRLGGKETGVENATQLTADNLQNLNEFQACAKEGLIGREDTIEVALMVGLNNKRAFAT
jgi:hypothetical protein